MADQLKGRTRRDDDTLVPLLTGLVVLAAAGPALFSAATQWLLPRLTAGTETVSLSLAEWWARNTWLIAFWVAEIAVLLVFLGWSRRRQRRRQRQLESVSAGLARALPADWNPQRSLRVLRWRGHHPVRVRLWFSPRSSLDDRAWRQSVVDAATRVLGRLEPVDWPAPPRTGPFDWGSRPPRIDLRVAAAGPAGAAGEPVDSEPAAPDPPADFRISDPFETIGRGGSEEIAKPAIYRRPVRTTSERAQQRQHRPAATRLTRED